MGVRMASGSDRGGREPGGREPGGTERGGTERGGAEPAGARHDTRGLPGADALNARLASAERVRLFLDYDGTLAEFARSPDSVQPDPELLALLGRLAGEPRLRIAVVSGRRLDHVTRLLSVPGLVLAGTYGVELLTPEGERIDRVALETVRPVLERIRPRWAGLLEGRVGFHLEDKGWSLALHARFASEDEAAAVLAAAEQVLDDELPADVVGRANFRVLGGDRFLEVGPALANKGRAVEHLLGAFPWPDALPVYVGDDDKDEEAFRVIQANGGLAVVVAAASRPTRAGYRLESPAAVREWLAGLPEVVGRGAPG